MKRNRDPRVIGVTWVAAAVVVIVGSGNVAHAQVNPNFVLYNPNLDVYAKPDVHILAKAIAAQNELAMTKLAHLGMLQPKK